jgi:sulfonate transport system substrate-binding protein
MQARVLTVPVPVPVLVLVLRTAGVLLAGFLLTGCSRTGATDSTQPSGELPLVAPLPDVVPPGTRLVIGDPMTQRVLEHNGWLRELHFKVEWAQISGGPAVTEAFHANALDVGSAADMPPIHAVWVDIPVKIIAVQLHRDPINHPLYVLGVAPHAAVAGLADLRGKRIAFSPGQVQGEIVLRTLRQQGLTARDVKLVELPSSGDTYVDVLGADGVDVAPLAAGAVSRRFLERYGPKGARLLRHAPFRDDLTLLYVRVETLQSPAKAAALREYVRLWARATEWTDAHPAEWARIYWTADQGLSPADARYEVDALGPRYVPTDWREAIAIEQSAIDLVASATSHRRFDATLLFDPRFAPVVAGAL